MSSSNIAVSMEHAATDQLSHPPRPMLRVVANRGRQLRSGPPRISLTNRKFPNRDHGLRYFRIR